MTQQPHNPGILAGSLPYQTVATGARLQALPDHLRWRFRTALADPYGAPLAEMDQATVNLAGRKLTLSFVPATQADLDVINSYLPAPHPDGSPIDPSELPSSLPGYLIRLKAEIRVDGQLVSESTASVTMGSAITQTAAYYNPATRQWEEGGRNLPIAGEYHALALDLQGVSASQLDALKTRLEATKARLEQFQAHPDDPTPIENLTKEDLSGDLLYAGILSYFASVDGCDQLAARANGDIVAYRLPSYGAFSAAAQPSYFFGIVRNVSFPGVAMDVDRVRMHAEAKDADPAKRIAYLRQVGAAGSAFEHAVPERLFADPLIPLDDPSQPQGISAVKALAIAAAQGQRIYTLNASNRDYHVGIVAGLGTDAQTKAEIADALNAGLEVTVHQSDITAHGWTGSGYILLDPETGAGAYKIAGGANGGVLNTIPAALLLVLLGFYLDFIGVALVIGIVAGLLGLLLNAQLQKWLDLNDQQQILVSAIELFAVFVLLNVAAMLAPAIVVSTLVAFYFAFLGLLWDVFV